MQELRINGPRLWQSLMEMASVGATPAGGCNRQALTDEDKIGRDLFVGWCKEAGCEVTVDAMGNTFARRSGKDDSRPPVLAGSHLDTQPTGGKFDGPFGVLSALEVVRTLNDHEVETEGPVEIVNWTNEEGARFSPAMIASGVWAGEFTLEHAHAIEDADGLSIGDELERIRYRGDEPASAHPVKAAFEPHIEQGPILEREGKPIGIVTGVQAMRWYDVILEGTPCHAGTTPMEGRRDPLRALHRLLASLYAMAHDVGPDARVTFGQLRAEPSARNTVPQTVVLSIDLRHPEQDTLVRMEERMHQAVAEASASSGIDSRVRTEWDSPSVEFDPACIDAVRTAADRLGYAAREMVSGAGHDAVYLSRVAPTSMIFIPCKDGLSHNEAEWAEPGHVEAGCNVLLHAMLERDRA